MTRLEKIENARALDKVYSLAMAHDFDIGKLDLHEDIYELLQFYMKENDLKWEDLKGK